MPLLQNQLVFGYRRIRAYTEISGRAEIEARIIDLDAIVNGSYDIDKLKQEFLSVNGSLSDVLSILARASSARPRKRSDCRLPSHGELIHRWSMPLDLVELIDSGQRTVGGAFPG